LSAQRCGRRASAAEGSIINMFTCSHVNAQSHPPPRPPRPVLAIASHTRVAPRVAPRRSCEQRDATYEVFIDQQSVRSGRLEDDFAFLPPKTIPDPKFSKPADWVDARRIRDPEAVKPEGWDDVPETIPDPDAEKPDTWDQVRRTPYEVWRTSPAVNHEGCSRENCGCALQHALAPLARRRAAGCSWHLHLPLCTFQVSITSSLPLPYMQLCVHQ
jgi:Calreticulin family